MTEWFDAKQKLLPVKNVADASKRLGLRSMIVLQELPTGQWGYTSYGSTRANCRRAQVIADQLLAKISEDTE